jgi:hypothetical protein
VADKAGIHKILVEEDLVKAPYHDKMRLHPGIPIIVTETDKVSHKRMVDTNAAYLAILLTIHTLEASFITGFLHWLSQRP